MGYQPNGCTVKDGMVYLVETRADYTGSLGMYDIDSGVFNYSTDLFNVTGDGIVASDDYLFATSWADGGKLFSLDLSDDSAVFEVLVTNLTSPADICINEDEGMIAIPSLLTGKIWFYEYDDGDDSAAAKITVMSAMAVSLLAV